MIRFDQIEQSSLTDVGVRRSHNQDSLAVLLAPDEEQWKKAGHLFLVADGMGGHAVGEKASELAAQIIPHTYSKHASEDPHDALRKSFLEANASINACGEQNNEFRGMGTTSTALVLRPDGAFLGHVGDSRTYRIRNGVIQQLTYDHSYVWEYARIKHIDPADVQDFPTNVIHRCLGPQPLVEVDVEGPHPLEEGDTFVLCSDGLSGQVTDHEIGVVASILPPTEACRFLVDLANLRGGPDNITVLVVRVGARKTAPSTPTIQVLKPKSWLQRFPWPIVSLVAGCLLAAGAIALQICAPAYASVATLAFGLAIIPIVAGLGGLILYHKRQSKVQATHEQPGQPHIYRQSPCHIDKVLLEKLSRAAIALKLRAEEKQWSPDLAAFAEHQKRAEKFLNDSDLPSAFREYCLAMRPLSEALEKHRSKEESFQPVWDKSPK